MLSLLTSGFSLLVLITGSGVKCQQLTAGKIEEFSSEGSSVNLTCSYNKDSANYLFWYRQNPGQHPEFLKSHSPFGGAESLDRMTFKGNKEEMSMTISSAAVTDSAVYYCAVRTDSSGFKMIFGSGTSLTIEPKEENKPDYYNLGPANDDDDTTVCLATGFTRHNATMNETGFDNKTASQISDFSGKPSGVYSQVTFLAKGEKCGDNKDDEGKPKVPCDANLEPDEMVNLASITIFGLRVIFMKTVAFNVLMTLRLWMSQ